VDDFSPRYSDLTIFKMKVVGHLQFSKFEFLCHVTPICHASLLHHEKFQWSRTIGCWVMAKNDFQYGGRPPSWICFDVIVLHHGIHFHGPNIAPNFHLDWFCSFWDIQYRYFSCILMNHDNSGVAHARYHVIHISGVKCNPILVFSYPCFLSTT